MKVIVLFLVACTEQVKVLSLEQKELKNIVSLQCRPASVFVIGVFEDNPDEIYYLNCNKFFIAVDKTKKSGYKRPVFEVAVKIDGEDYPLDLETRTDLDFAISMIKEVAEKQRKHLKATMLEKVL